MVETGISEEVELIDSGSNDRTTLLGLYNTATFQIDETTEPERSIDSGGKPAEIRDGPVNFTASLTCKPTTLEALRIMGSYTTFDSGNQYRINFNGGDQLESHSFLRGQIMDNSTDSKYFEFTSVKFGEFELSSSAGDVVELSFPTIMALDGTIQDGTVDAATTSGVPLQWSDADVKIGGTTVGTVESFNMTVTRNISSEHAITSSTGASARKPVAIVEGNYEFNPSIVFKVEDPRAWEEALDDSGTTLQVQGSRTSDNVELAFGGTSGSLIFDNAKFEINEYELSEDKDTRTVELDGQAESVKVEGDT